MQRVRLSIRRSDNFIFVGVMGIEFVDDIPYVVIKWDETPSYPVRLDIDYLYPRPGDVQYAYALMVDDPHPALEVTPR